LKLEVRTAWVREREPRRLSIPDSVAGEQ